MAQDVVNDVAMRESGDEVEDDDERNQTHTFGGVQFAYGPCTKADAERMENLLAQVETKERVIRGYIHRMGGDFKMHTEDRDRGLKEKRKLQRSIEELEKQLEDKKERLIRCEGKLRDSEASICSVVRDYERSKDKFDKFIEGSRKAAKFVADHPYYKATAYSRECSICAVSNPRRRVVLVECGHILCRLCAEESDAASTGSIACPFCRAETKYVQLCEDGLAREVRPDPEPPYKVRPDMGGSCSKWRPEFGHYSEWLKERARYEKSRSEPEPPSNVTATPEPPSKVAPTPEPPSNVAPIPEPAYKLRSRDIQKKNS